MTVRIQELVRQHAAVRPLAPALLDTRRAPLDYRTLLQRIDRTADALRGFGISPGDRVAVVLPDGPDMALAFLAVSTVAAAATG